MKWNEKYTSYIIGGGKVVTWSKPANANLYYICFVKIKFGLC